jgi:hypothetical protein
MTLKSSLYLLPKFSRVTLTIVLILLISTIVNGTLLNFGKRYEGNIRVIFDQWPKLQLGLDVLSNQKILNGILYVSSLPQDKKLTKSPLQRMIIWQKNLSI